MDAIFNLFVGQPLVQLAISGLFFLVYFFTFHNPNLRAKVLLTPAVLWLVWGAWEGMLLQVSPGANIRIDLLIILPVVFIVSTVAVVVFFQKPKVLPDDEHTDDEFVDHERSDDGEDAFPNDAG